MSIDELTVLTCGIGEYSWEFLGLQGDQASQPKGNQSWVFIEKTDAEAETPILWPHDAKNWLIRKDLWCWERLKAGGEGNDSGWMASPTWWTWAWASFGRWWWKGKPGVLQSMGSQRVRRDWATELNWTEREGGEGNSWKGSRLWWWMANTLVMMITLVYTDAELSDVCLNST